MALAVAGRLIEDPSNLELLVREDVALQQLVLASMATNPLVVEQAVKVIAAAGMYVGAAKRLVKHNVVQAITDLTYSHDKVRGTCGGHALCSGVSTFLLHQKLTSAFGAVWSDSYIWMVFLPIITNSRCLTIWSSNHHTHSLPLLLRLLLLLVCFADPAVVWTSCVIISVCWRV